MIHIIASMHLSGTYAGLHRQHVAYQYLKFILFQCLESDIRTLFCVDSDKASPLLSN